MIVDVYPSTVRGKVTPPPSKSFLHRLIICASLACGKSTIKNISYSEDILATLQAFEELGVEIKRNKDSIIINSKGMSVLEQEKTVNCNESGSTIRFLIPIFSNNYKSLFIGNYSLFRRPFGVYENIFKKQNLVFNKTEKNIETLGALKPGNYEVPGNISSQFISGLLFILPTLESNSTIKVTGDFESSSYVDITVSVLKTFGINIEKFENIYHIRGNQTYQSTDVFCENDYSQLAFHAVLGTINNNIQILRMNKKSIQPDKKILEIIEKMGGKLEIHDSTIHVKKSQTKATTIDVSQCPDIAPIIGLLAAVSNGTTHIINAKRLTMKESNRLQTTHDILKQMGVSVSINKDSLSINGTAKLKGGVFDSYQDHRIAMTLGVAGTICDSSITIMHAEAINKSYPSFFDDLKTLGVNLQVR